MSNDAPALHPSSEADEAPQEERDAIEDERERRLDPDNRPDNAEVDNTDRDFDVVRGRFEDTEVEEELGPFNDPEAEDGEAEA